MSNPFHFMLKRGPRIYPRKTLIVILVTLTVPKMICGLCFSFTLLKTNSIHKLNRCHSTSNVDPFKTLLWPSKTTFGDTIETKLNIVLCIQTASTILLGLNPYPVLLSSISSEKGQLETPFTTNISLIICSTTD